MNPSTVLLPAPAEILVDPMRLPPPPVGRAFVSSRPVPGVRTAPPATVPVGSLSDQWHDEPSMPNQLQMPDAVRPEKVEVLTLQTDKPADMVRYAELLSSVRGPKARRQLLEHDRQFHNGAWLIFLVVQHFQFRRVLEKKP